MTTLQLLNENNLKELIPKMGHRLKLQEYLKKRFSLNSTLSTGSTVIIDNSFDLSVSDDTAACSSDVLSPPCKKKCTESIDICTEDTKSSNQVYPEGNVNIFRDNMNLKQYLKSTRTGTAIMQTFAASKALGVNQRKTLVHLIADELVEQNIRVTNYQFDVITDELVSIFPNENKGTYFLSPVHGRKIAGGKLVERFRNQRRILNEAAKHEQSINSSVKVTQEDTEKLQWLQQVSDPWSKTVLYWEQTYTARHNQMPSTIQEYFDAYPALTMPLGYTLVSKYLGFTQAYAS